MSRPSHRLTRSALKCMAGVLLATTLGVAGSTIASADEASARKQLKAMSDYLAAQKAISFGYDATYEVITKDDQKLALVSSGDITLNRPDKIRATRSGGFADVEFLFDGKTLTLLGKNANTYVQIAAPGTVENLIDELREKFHWLTSCCRLAPLECIRRVDARCYRHQGFGQQQDRRCRM